MKTLLSPINVQAVCLGVDRCELHLEIDSERVMDMQGEIVVCECENATHFGNAYSGHEYQKETAEFEAVYYSDRDYRTSEFWWEICGFCVDFCHWKTEPELKGIRNSKSGKYIA